MGNIVQNLRNLHDEYRMGTQSGNLDTFKDKGTYDRTKGSQQTIQALDSRRMQILDDFNAIAQRVGVPPLTLVLAQHPSFTVDHLDPRSEPVGVESTGHRSQTSPDLAREGPDAEGGWQSTDLV
jgi:hypothetical protein